MAMPKIDGKYVADMPEFKAYLKRVYPKGITYWPRPGGSEDHVTYKWHGYDTDLAKWNQDAYNLVEYSLLRSGAVEGFMKEEAEKRAKAQAEAQAKAQAEAQAKAQKELDAELAKQREEYEKAQAEEAKKKLVLI